MFRVLTVGLAFLLTACSMASSKAGQQVKDADQATVSGCKYLGEVAGWSGWGGLASGVGMTNSQNSARNKAGAMGATHIVWNIVSAGYTPSANGKAYRCEK